MSRPPSFWHFAHTAEGLSAERGPTAFTLTWATINAYLRWRAIPERVTATATDADGLAIEFGPSAIAVRPPGRGRVIFPRPTLEHAAREAGRLS